MLRDSKLIFFDTETTGLNPKKERITELAFITPDITYDEFVKLPEGMKVPEKIVELTGITDEILETQGRNESEVALAFWKELSKDTILIAHNAQFDLNFIKNLFERNGLSFPEGCSYIDTVTIARDVFPYPHKLCSCIEYLNIKDVQNTHRAIDDTLALKAVFEEFVKRGVDMEKYINIFGYNPKHGIFEEQIDGILYRKQYYVHDFKI